MFLPLSLLVNSAHVGEFLHTWLPWGLIESPGVECEALQTPFQCHRAWNNSRNNNALGKWDPRHQEHLQIHSISNNPLEASGGVYV